MKYKEGERVRHRESGKQGFVLADADGPETQVLFDDAIISVFMPTESLEILTEQE
jgi:hypothetical protein